MTHISKQASSSHMFSWLTPAFFLKVALLTCIFVLVRTILLYTSPPPYNDHTHEHERASWNEKKREDIHITWGQDETYAQQIIDDIIQQHLDRQAQWTPENSKRPQEHQAATATLPQARQRYALICNTFPDICKLTLWEWIFSDSETLIYQAIVIHMFLEINSYLIADVNLEDRVQYFKIYKDGTWRRWSASHDYLKIDVAKIKTLKEFWEVSMHELWHVVDFSIIVWSSPIKDKDFTEFWKIQWPIDDPSLDYYRISRHNENIRKWEAWQLDFVSWYAMRGMYEDMAEAHNLYVNHNAYFQTIAANNTALTKKYTFFKTLYNNRYYKNLGNNYLPIYKRHWDTTRIE